MTTAGDANDADGRFLLKVSTDALSPVVMYVLAAIGLTLGGLMLWSAVPHLFDDRQEYREEGQRGCGAAALILGGGCLAFWSGRSRTTIYKLVFTSNGVRIDRKGAVLCPWKDLLEFRVEIQKPGHAKTGMAVAKGVGALLSGNAGGVMKAAMSAETCGRISLKFSRGAMLLAKTTDVVSLEEVADCATKAGRVDVLTVVT